MLKKLFSPSMYFQCYDKYVYKSIHFDDRYRIIFVTSLLSRQDLLGTGTDGENLLWTKRWGDDQILKKSLT